MGLFERVTGRRAKREENPPDAPMEFPVSSLASESAADPANSDEDGTAALGETEDVAIDSSPVAEGPATGDGALEDIQEEPEISPLADEGEPDSPSADGEGDGDGDFLMDIFTSESDEEDVDRSALTHLLEEIGAGPLLEEATRVSASLGKRNAGDHGPDQGAV